MAIPSWLSPLCNFEQFGGNWPTFLEHIYQQFSECYTRKPFPTFQGDAVSFKRHPEVQGKAATFWHLISEGEIEDDRLPNMRRCERIPWAREIIEHCDDPEVKVWDVRRGNELRTLLWCEEAEYVVVLARRKNYSILWTAYPVIENHRKRKFQSEYAQFVAKKAEAANS